MSSHQDYDWLYQRYSLQEISIRKKPNHSLLHKAIEKHLTYRGRRQYPVGNAKGRSQDKSHIQSNQPAHQGDGHPKCCSNYNPCTMMLVIDHLERRWLSRGDNNIGHGIRVCSNISSNSRAFARNIAGNALIYGKSLRRGSSKLIGKAEQESAQRRPLFRT